MRFLSSSVLLILVSSIASLYREANAREVCESNVEQRTVGGQRVPSERDEQEQLFDYYFQDRNLKYETKLSQLKTVASVPTWRIPYSAAIHPLSQGGMSPAGGGILLRRSNGPSALRVYDRAFHESRNLAAAYELRQVMGGIDRALFPGLRMRRSNEDWEGYCSGFTAAAIRHPEPIRAVDAGNVGGESGIEIQPADIKALLSYIYNRTTDDSFLYLAPPSAEDGGPNMGTFHLALANYIGQAGHPIGIDRTKGQPAWNNPVYAYEVTSIRDAEASQGRHAKTVETTLTYSYYGSDSRTQTDPETGDRQGNVKRTMTFRYTLALDEEGRIVGGAALDYNAHFLWLPLYAVQGQEDGSAPGNPHVDVEKVLALARAAALPDVQQKFDDATVGPCSSSRLSVPDGPCPPHETR
jgi:hypothetical protein